MAGLIYDVGVVRSISFGKCHRAPTVWLHVLTQGCRYSLALGRKPPLINRDIFSSIPSGLRRKNEKIFLKRLKVNIVENIDSTNITYDDLCNEFGYPSDIIISYFEDQDANYLIKQSRIRNILKKAIIICTVAILVCCLWRGILIYKSYHDSKNSKVKHIEKNIRDVKLIIKKIITL